MEEKKNILTYEGLRKYEDELHNLKSGKKTGSGTENQRGQGTGRPFRKCRI